MGTRPAMCAVSTSTRTATESSPNRGSTSSFDNATTSPTGSSRSSSSIPAPPLSASPSGNPLRFEVPTGKLRCRVGHDHPWRAEAVDAQPEGGGEERLAQRHLDLSAFGERVEHALGLRGVRNREVHAHAVHVTVEVARGIVGAHEQVVAGG